MRKDLKISGFKTPEKYFDNFEEHLFARLEEEKLPKSSGFKVPDDYFNNLEEIVVAREMKSRKQAKIITLFPKKFYNYIAIAAACLVFGIMIFNFNQNRATLDTIQLGLIDTYIEEGNLNMNLYDISTFFDANEIPVVDFQNQYISQTDLKNYLLENTDEAILINGW